MRSTTSVSAALVFVLFACGPGTPDEPVVEAACPITEPNRLVAAPPDFQPAEDAYYGLHRFDDDILYTFDRLDDPEREYWRLNRCTGEAEPYPALAPGLHNPFVVHTPGGRILYGNDEAGRPYVIDRFDELGSDVARPVPGLPEGVTFIGSSTAPSVSFFLFAWSDGPNLFDAAGVGAGTYAIYVHHGDPDVPALRLSDRLLSAYYFDDQHSLTHEDNGEVNIIDEVTGARELLLTGVRYLSYGFDDRTFIWQAMGDDAVEPVFLHRLDTGEDVQIAVNDFAALSWNRGEHREAGNWNYSDWRDGVAAAMVGPDNRYVAAVRLDTGEALEIPEHLEQHGSYAGQFQLLRASDGGEVEAFWDPLTGQVREWYRTTTERRPTLLLIDGDLVEYFVHDPDDYHVGSLWRVDLATGDAVLLLEDVGAYPSRINETQYLVETPHGYIEGPPTGEPGFRAYDFSDLALVDVASGERSPIAERVSARVHVPEGLVFLDAFGPEPGLWAYPLPYEEPRSAARSGLLRRLEPPRARSAPTLAMP
ncbi:hypothetical protein [Nannocystis sp. SCPEA4]|uniref:hypothetical protein n=1 Tax=Nannocystis sp. SCPEA4 TaxID=2996787 RepID=UPI0022710022|nr:hypothetical protein [Nannocystis sp. SCPEA4]MCY1060137.1 hypothetical protein [Nannocystis sp. SCPEA4]